MKKYALILVGLVLVLTQVGCSTIINGNSQSVSISSEPTGAKVDVGGNPAGKTPLTVVLARKKSHLVTISMDGYQTEQVTINKVLTGAVAGNIIAGGFIGWGVDAITGAQYKLKPDTIAVTLRRGTTDPSQLYDSVDSITPSDRLRQLERLRNDDLITEDEYQATRKSIVEKLDE